MNENLTDYRNVLEEFDRKSNTLYEPYFGF